jgi:hypothetical protein
MKRYAPDPIPPPADSLDAIVTAALTREARRITWAARARSAPLAVDPAVLARKSSQGRTNGGAAATKARAAARWRHTHPVTRQEP